MTPSEFNQLTPAQKRVAVAKDVIEQLRAAKYVAHAGRYVGEFYFTGHTFRTDADEVPDHDIQEALPRIERCHVCAVGACLLSITKYTNKIKFRDVGRKQDCFSPLSDTLLASVFTPEQLAIIEICFEGGYQRGRDNYGRDRLGAKLSDRQIDDACLFYGERTSEGGLLLDIMQNIIDNDGEIVLR